MASRSRQVLSLVFAVAAVQLLEIYAESLEIQSLENYEADTLCDEFDGRLETFGTKFTTLRISYNPDNPVKVNLLCVRREDKGCITTQCMPKSGSKRDEECRVVTMKDEKKNKTHTLNAYQEDCSSTEEKIVCCQPGSNDNVLLAGYGAEAHEFPHQALLVRSLKKKDRSAGYNENLCGGTIYNENYILTAAHCVVDSYDHPTYQSKPGDPTLQYSEAHEVRQIEVVVGTNIGMTARASNRYRVEDIIIHPYYTKLKNNTDELIRKGDIPYIYQYDVALIKIKGTIHFDEYTKALRIAPPDFRPQDYAEKVVIAGWGTTDNLVATEYLQKSNLKIRNKDSRGPCSKTEGYMPDQHMCIGGIIDDVEYGKTAGGGDSGGPAICRDENGFGVHCGITSFGGDETKCSETPSSAWCSPSVYSDVSYFRQWIITNAGAQDTGNTQFYQVPLYGVNAGNELAQVKIISDDGKTCGGTLVSADKVVTASNCVFDEKDEVKTLIVKFGSADYSMKSVQLLGPTGNAKRKVVNQDFYNLWKQYKHYIPLGIEEPYYDEHIAVIKLSKPVSGVLPVSFSKSKLVESEDTVYEAAWMRNSTFGLRKFPSSVISNENCKRRYDPLSPKNTTFPISPGDVCMVEEYSGGNICDRELGGGVFCGGPNGITLCGVQVFRMCDYSAPKIIADMSYYAKRIMQMT